jgi:hypothetical protein
VRVRVEGGRDSVHLDRGCSLVARARGLVERALRLLRGSRRALLCAGGLFDSTVGLLERSLEVLLARAVVDGLLRLGQRALQSLDGAGGLADSALELFVRAGGLRSEAGAMRG